MSDEIHIKAEWDCWHGGKYTVTEVAPDSGPVSVEGRDTAEFEAALRGYFAPEKPIVIDYGFGALVEIGPKPAPA